MGKCSFPSISQIQLLDSTTTDGNFLAEINVRCYSRTKIWSLVGSELVAIGDLSRDQSCYYHSVRLMDHESTVFIPQVVGSTGKNNTRKFVLWNTKSHTYYRIRYAEQILGLCRRYVRHFPFTALRQTIRCQIPSFSIWQQYASLT